MIKSRTVTRGKDGGGDEFSGHGELSTADVFKAEEQDRERQPSSVIADWALRQDRFEELFAGTTERQSTLKVSQIRVSDRILHQPRILRSC